MRAPDFWRRGAASPWPGLLAPAASLYDAGRRALRATARPGRAPVPVFCVGAATVGGAGKTPTAIALARRLLALGRSPALVTRGYRGSELGPHRVDPARDGVERVGDEALLLASVAPCWVARDRIEGARAAAEEGADCAVLDDGLQNPRIAKDLTLLVVDGEAGFGNGRLLPAGPLREPVAEAIARADAVLVIGADAANLAALLPRALPLLAGRLLPPPAAAARLRGRRVAAFAGIGLPEKFRRSLEAAGAEIVEFRAFPDHHRYRAEELAPLLARSDLVPVTTAKDFVRLPPEVAARVQILEIGLEIADWSPLDRLLARR
jgi:tetraacyldisaccharide 4'-kinase